MYAAPLRDGRIVARRQFLFQLAPGALIIAPPERTTSGAVGWAAVPSLGARLVALSEATLVRFARKCDDLAGIARMLRPWLSGMSAALGERAGALEAEFAFVGANEAELATWLADPGKWTEDLRSYLRVAKRMVEAAWQAQESDALAAMRAKAEADGRILERAAQELKAAIDERPAGWVGEGENALHAAVRLIMEAMKVEIAEEERARVAHMGGPDAAKEIGRAFGLKTRQTLLAGQWWREDNGPLLAFTRVDGRPVALLPDGPTRYTLHDPQEGRVVAVDRNAAETLEAHATTFYRPLPRKRLKPLELVLFGLRSVSRTDMTAVILLGHLGGLLAILPPVITGVLFGAIIPEQNYGALFYMTVILTASAVASLLFGVAQAVAMIRIETKMQTSIQAAVWDRLLGLSIQFFRQYSAGDLAHRALSVHAISQMVSGTALRTVLAGSFVVFGFALLFFYDVQLALLAGGMAVGSVLVFTSFGLVQIPLQRAMMDLEGKTLSLVLQVIQAIPKFRAAGGESRAFRLWAQLFKDLRRATYRARRSEVFLILFNTLLPVVATAALFVAVFQPDQAGLSAGEFIAFSAAFGGSLTSLIAISSIAISMTRLVPLYERLNPILEAEPETDGAKEDPGLLRGAVEVNQLYFRYDSEAPPVLNGVSLHAAPGEFIAIVGPSGSGKSTLIKCLLGFEAWESGMIYYDGRSLEDIDVRAVRRQIGTVLQGGRLIAADIFTNICGSSTALTLYDAWQAAEGAGIADEIRRMPMGMHTMINEGATTISGGQRQRLLIARAIVRKPPIVLFDEATSALDNQTQEIVSKTLEQMRATRIVVAHRLSTVRNADRIYVLDKGRVVQVGRFDDLIEQDGIFAELARRQLV